MSSSLKKVFCLQISLTENVPYKSFTDNVLQKKLYERENLANAKDGVGMGKSV